MIDKHLKLLTLPCTILFYKNYKKLFKNKLYSRTYVKSQNTKLMLKHESAKTLI